MTSAEGTAYIERITPEGIAIVVIDYVRMNALSDGLRDGLVKVVRDIEGGMKERVKGIVLRGAGRAFCAGANFTSGFGGAREYEHLGRESSGPFGFGLEDNVLGVPVVAAIHGFALGGGLELAMTAHYRVAMAGSAIGLPEVNIGVLPGGQGTQRLPRMIGAKSAIEVMCSGEHISAHRAKEMGIVDKVVDTLDVKVLVREALALCTEKAKLPRHSHPWISKMKQPVPNCDFDAMRAFFSKKRRGEPAPLAIIDCVEACCTMGWEAGLEFEKKTLQTVSHLQSHAHSYTCFKRKGKANASLIFHQRGETLLLAKSSAWELLVPV